MRRFSLRRAAILSVAAIGIATTTGCFGSFQLTRKVYAFNKSVSSDKFVQELVFLGLNIVPVYSLAGFADAIFANTVEFWTGSNPMAASRTVRPDGTTLLQTGSNTTDGKTLVIDEVKNGETLSTTTITSHNATETVTVETRFKNGRRFSKTLARQADGSVTME